MGFRRCLELLQQYNECPRCGNDEIGNGEGTLEIDEDKFVRTCKCGWRVEEIELFQEKFDGRIKKQVT